MTKVRTNLKEPVKEETLSLWYSSDIDESAETPLTSSADIYHLGITTTAGSDRYIALYDKATAATSGDTPFFVYRIMPNTVLSLPLNYTVSNGLSIRASTQVDLSDGTPPITNDVFLFITYKNK